MGISSQYKAPSRVWSFQHLFKYCLLACVVTYAVVFVASLHGNKEPRDHTVYYSETTHGNVPNAAFVVLLKQDAKSIALATRALASLESAFNHRHHYPLVVFHEGQFEDTYKTQLQNVFSGNIAYEQVQFEIPDFLEQDKIPETITAYSRNFSIGYRHMCRFYAGGIAQHLR
jgi:hypothetical protein